MPMIFEQCKQGSWQGHLLDGDELPLEPWPEDGVAACRFPTVPADVGVAIRRVNLLQGEGWVLITSGQGRVRHNGMAVMLHLAVLADRDALVVADAMSPPGRRFYFSTQSPARVESAPAGLANCPRCKCSIEPPSPAVRCPRCHVWHHQCRERECWTYADRCAACREQLTSLGGELSWTPEEL